jgi:hypothetical protein
MFEKVEQFLASTFSQAEFCQQESLAYWTFRYWLKRYRLKETLSCPPVQAPAGFVALHAVPGAPPPQPSTCVIEYPSGIVVRLNGNVDPTLVTHLIDVAGD